MPKMTAEQIVAKALNRLPNGRGDFHEGSAHVVNVVHDLRAHGLLSEGAPSEEQVERAARAGHEHTNGIGAWEAATERIRKIQRARFAAGFAAAGVAPQEPSTAAHSTPAASALCDEVIADLGDNVQTHGPDCYRWHAGCLALRVRQALAPQEPNVLAGRCRTCGGEVLEGTAEDVIDYLDAPPPDREKLIAEAEAHWVELNGLNSRAAEVMMELAALAAQPVLDLNAERADAWEEGVATALNHAKRGSDGITLKLVTFDGDAWPNPYREAAKRGELNG
jgi:hypothetical protein